MRPYIIACTEVLRKRNVLKPGLTGAEADALVTSLGLQDEAVTLAAELMDPNSGTVIPERQACPECAARPHPKAVELILRLQIPPTFRSLSIHPSNHECACSVL